MDFVTIATLAAQTLIITPRLSGQILRFNGQDVTTIGGQRVKVAGTGPVEVSSGWWDDMIVLAGTWGGEDNDFLAKGDMWWQLDPVDQADVVGIQVWNGYQWGPYRIVADSVIVPGSAGDIVLADGAVTAPKVNAESIWGDAVWAQLATVNVLKAGAVESETLSVGARPAQGEATNRVPAPMTDQAYWSKVIDGTINLGGWAISRATAGAAGVTLAPTGAEQALVNVTASPTPLPASRKLHLQWAATAAVRAVVTWRTGDGTSVSTALVGDSLLGAAEALAPETATHYSVDFRVLAGGAAATLLDAKVFEVIGAGGNQRVEISPSGLRMFDAEGSQVISLGTSSDDMLAINKKNALGQLVTVASIDTDGNIAGNSLSTDTDIEYPGGLLIGDAGDLLYNGQLIDTPLLERPVRGMVYSADLGSDSGGRLLVNGDSEYQALGNGRATFSAGRLYTVRIDTPFIAGWTAGAGPNALSLEVWVGASAQNVKNPNGWSYRWPMLESTAAVGDRFPVFFPASVPFTADGERNILVRLVRSDSGTNTYQVYNLVGNVPSIVIEEAGPDIPAFQGGSIKNRTKSASTDPTPPDVTPPNPTPKTKTLLASWSVAWNSAGSGTWGSSGSMYQDGRMLYNGGAGDWSRMSQVGFPALGLPSGATITGMWIDLQCRHTGLSSAATLHFGTHNNASAPSGSKPSRVNGWTGSIKKGKRKRFPIPSARWAAFLSGTHRGISIGNGGASIGDYAILDGAYTTNATGSSRFVPRLIVSYTS